MIQLDNKKILVVVAHPDDELLGLGATIHKLVKYNNCIARAVILGEGITSRSDQRDRAVWKEELEIHRKNIYAAQKCIGYESVGIYDFPDNRFDSVALLDIVKIIEKEKREFIPDVIFTHHNGDLNIDHRITSDAVVTATRPLQDESVKTILSFETPSATEWQASNYPTLFNPNVYCTFEKDSLEAKIDGLNSYKMEVRDYPHPRSPEGLEILAKYRGMIVGALYAEAFYLLRTIVEK
jgi:N-acetylglucosamine malate deacetylase 1